MQRLKKILDKISSKLFFKKRFIKIIRKNFRFYKMTLDLSKIRNKSYQIIKKPFIFLWNNEKLGFWEKLIVRTLLIFIIFCLSFSLWKIYLKNTKLIPVFGGTYTEGLIGQPQYINPILASTNTDFSITNLVFSGLTKYNQEGELIGDLSARWEIAPGSKKYTFYLKDDLYWHDGEPVTSDDVIFTVESIQHPDYQGNLVAAWDNIKVKKINDKTIEFNLDNSYAPFLSNTTLGILPKHLLVDIKPIDLPTYSFNLEPIGTGPYQFDNLKLGDFGVSSLTLKINHNWYTKRFHDERGEFQDSRHRGGPYIEKITFNFYPDPPSLIEAYKRKEIMGIEEIGSENIKDLEGWKDLKLYKTKLPSYTALFLNQKSKIIQNKKIREALSYAINKREIIDKALFGQANNVFNPILPGFLGYTTKIKVPSYNPKKASDVLDKAGFKKLNKEGIRTDGKFRLNFSLVTSDDPAFIRTCEILERQLKEVGIGVQIKIFDTITLQEEFISTRNYDILLYGQSIGRDVDPFPYWHSTQAVDPGLNLSCFSNINVDKLLEQARLSSDSKIRDAKYKEFSKILAAEIPAIFLYSPIYTYAVNERIEGINLGKISLTSDRFLGINDWYIKKKRVRR